MFESDTDVGYMLKILCWLQITDPLSIYRGESVPQHLHEAKFLLYSMISHERVRLDRKYISPVTPNGEKKNQILHLSSMTYHQTYCKLYES